MERNQLTGVIDDFVNALLFALINRIPIPDDKISHDVASGSEITPCNKIEKLLVVDNFIGNVVTSITTLRT